MQITALIVLIMMYIFIPSSSLVITEINHVGSLVDFRKKINNDKPQVLVWRSSDSDVSNLLKRDIIKFTYDKRNELFDREFIFMKDQIFSSRSFFAGLEHLNINATETFASVCIDMDDLIDSMRLVATETDSIICRLAIVSGVRCPKWHEDYVDLRLIKTYCGIGTDWVDPNNLQTRFLNYFRALADIDLNIFNSEHISHGECGSTIVIPGRKRKLKIPNSVPVLHRSPITEENCRRLLFTVTINAVKRAD